jgi:hypothetical protein
VEYFEGFIVGDEVSYEATYSQTGATSLMAHHARREATAVEEMALGAGAREFMPQGTRLHFWAPLLSMRGRRGGRLYE